MKTAALDDIKKELQCLSPAKLIDICVRLAKLKKENKELLSYILFESHDHAAIIERAKSEIDAGFAMISPNQMGTMRKRLDKVLDITVKYIRQVRSKPIEAELLIFYINCLHRYDLLENNIFIYDFYHSLKKRVRKVVSTLHEDLQHDYLKQLNRL